MVSGDALDNDCDGLVDDDDTDAELLYAVELFYDGDGDGFGDGPGILVCLWPSGYKSFGKGRFVGVFAKQEICGDIYGDNSRIGVPHPFGYFCLLIPLVQKEQKTGRDKGRGSVKQNPKPKFSTDEMRRKTEKGDSGYCTQKHVGACCEKSFFVPIDSVAKGKGTNGSKKVDQ